MPSVDAFDRGDEMTLVRFKEIVSLHHPRLVLLHFRGPDVAAHGNDWPGYLSEIEKCDQLMADCWKFLQQDSFYYKKTTLFMTNDHGRHSDNIKEGFSEHGDNCEGCTHINFYATGPDFKSNVQINEKRDLTSIAATIAELMGFSMDEDAGTTMNELFE